MKKHYPKTAHIFFMGRSIFSYFLRINLYNLRIVKIIQNTFFREYTLASQNRPKFTSLAGKK